MIQHSWHSVNTISLPKTLSTLQVKASSKFCFSRKTSQVWEVMGVIDNFAKSFFQVENVKLAFWMKYEYQPLPSEKSSFTSVDLDALLQHPVTWTGIGRILGLGEQTKRPWRRKRNCTSDKDHSRTDQSLSRSFALVIALMLTNWAWNDLWNKNSEYRPN